MFPMAVKAWVVPEEDVFRGGFLELEEDDDAWPRMLVVRRGRKDNKEEEGPEVREEDDDADREVDALPGRKPETASWRAVTWVPTLPYVARISSKLCADVLSLDG